MSELHGLTAAKLVEKLGEPASKESFRVGERQDEFHVQIQNTYRLPEAAQVVVQEWTWLDGTCMLTVWLHDTPEGWAAFASLRWPKGAEF
jgi:hypothetical protein